MEPQGPEGKGRIGVPFAVSRTNGRDLTSQIVDGLRRAIVCGYYKPGDVLPTLGELSAGLGVSMNVVRTAVRRLAEEGFILPRRHIGSVVQPLGLKIRRGHVLLVQNGTASSHANAIVGAIRSSLVRQGYLVTTVAVFCDANGRYDLVPLEMELRGTVNLAILVMNRPAVERMLAKSGIPFMIYGDRRCRAPNFAGLVRQSLGEAQGEVVDECARLGIKRILAVRMWQQRSDNLAERFAKAGMAIDEWCVWSQELESRDEAVQRAGLARFAERFRSEGRAWLPELLVFPDDDYLAAGCLMALLAEGVRVPEDVRVVTLANKGIAPVFIKPLSRLEIDPQRFGEKIAGYALDFLRGETVPDDAQVCPTYVPGETFP